MCVTQSSAVHNDTAAYRRQQITHSTGYEYDLHSHFLQENSNKHNYIKSELISYVSEHFPE